MAKLRLDEVVVTPSPPPAGAILLYAKTDDVVYVQDSLGNEVPIGTPDAITDLTGDVTANGPGSVPATVNFVGGVTAANVASGANLANAATSANTPSTIVRRDASGNFVASVITANLTGSASNNVLKAGDTMTGALVISVASTGAFVVGSSVLRVDTTNSRVGINQPSPTQALDVIGNGLFSGTVTASNISGSNTGDITVLDTNSIDLTLVGQLLSADLKLSVDAADAGNLKATTTIHSDGLHIEYLYGTPVQIGTANSAGAASGFALYDHVHAHGNQTSPTLHALATSLAHGFMSSTDKAKVDAELPASLGTSNQVLGVNNAGTAGEYKSLIGTANQIIITDGVGSKTFSTPQDIATSSNPTFNSENITTFLQFTQTSTPTTPAATKADLYIDNSNGFSRLRYLDETGSVQTILRDTIFLVRNNTGSTITKGQVVYVNGSSGTNVTVALAKADSSNTVPAIGLAYENIPNAGFGRVISIGIISGIDTSGFSVGDRVYLSATTAGALTNVKPTSPSSIWQRIGIVITSAVSGALEVRPLATHGEESGTNQGYTLNTVALTDAANIATDASLGNTFTVTLGGNRNLSAPTNPTNNQKIVYKITQDGTGNRTLTFDAVFRFGLDVLSPTLSTGAGKTDYIGFIYNSAATKWDCLAVSKGF